MRRNAVFLSAVVVLALPAFALRPTADELKAADTWRTELFGGDNAKLPFTFTYDGKKAPTAEWTRAKTADGFALRDPSGTVEARVQVRTYPGFPAFSWLLSFRNLSSAKSKVIAKVKPLDFRSPVASKSKTHLVHHAAGAMQSLNDYQQFTTLLSQEWWRQHKLHVQTEGGRSCEAAWPYFNIETPDAKAGLIAAIGWAGQWEADFDAMGDDRMKLTAGMSDSNFRLEPGESLRGPRAVVLLYRRGDWLEGQNLWRSWFLAHNAPRQNGRLVESQTMCSMCNGTDFGSDKMSAESMKAFIDAYAAHGLAFDYWWIDAAWYQWKNQWNDPKTKEPHWRWTGNWTPDPVRFPKGPGEVFAYAKEKCGAKGGILWFEIENAVTSTPVHQEHPDWFYPSPAYRGHFLNWSKKEAWDWAFKAVDGTLRREKANFYRQDFNFPPLWIWRDNDRRNGPDRTGVSEMKHVEALYRFYDAVLKADPTRRIDNCAQGGTRNDVETLSYAVPLWRTDTSGPVDEQQMQTAGISLWVPLYGGGHPAKTDVYELRSRLQPYLHLGVNAKDVGDWTRLKENLELWRKHCAPYYAKDFYPLTRSDAGADLWCAWEFVDAEKGEGFVQAFRRAQATSATFLVRPRGLDAAKSYVFEDVDTHETWTVRGGGEFEIRAKEPRTAKVLAFRPAGDAPVAILNDVMREYLNRPHWERVGLLQDKAFRAAALKAGSQPKPFELKVSGAGTGATVELYRVSDRKPVGTFPVKDGVAKIDNLEVAAKYAWRAMSGGKAVAKGRFVTEDGVPRVCRIDGTGNVRDLGGRRTVDGRRIRQGLVYRSATFNMTAWTPKDKKAEWKPGRPMVGEAAAKEALRTFGFRTDLDFRNEEETYGMTGSPLGPDVNWVRVTSSDYQGLVEKQWAAAFAKEFRTIADPKNHPLVFHCVGGADRTGTVAWILGGILGETEEDLWKDWELTVFNYDAIKFNHWNYMGKLTRLLEEKYPKLSAQERCVAYAKDYAGITDEEIDAFRRLMLE